MTHLASYLANLTEQAISIPQCDEFRVASAQCLQLQGLPLNDGNLGGAILPSDVNQGLRIVQGLLEEERFHQFFRIRDQKITFLDAEDVFSLELSQHSRCSFAGDSCQFG